MKILFDSLTGQVRKFVGKLPFQSAFIQEVEEVNEPFILVTYTTGFGEVPPSTASFLEKHGHFMQGVASSGNKVWGSNFAKSADRIAERWNVPIILKFELSGTETDVQTFIQQVEAISFQTAC